MSKRPDASMSLLTDIQQQALEPTYREYSQQRPKPLRLALALGLAALVITVAFLQTSRGAGLAAEQRAELLERIAAARQTQSDLSRQADVLGNDIRSLGDAALDTPSKRAELQTAEMLGSATAVSGPGIVIVVDDAPQASSAQSFVLDGDLRRLVNGLKQAGAEAIAINGRRLSTLTPIRAAGAAITVDYVSLSPPYTVEAIGDPQKLQARFNETSGASWWQFIVQNYGLTMSITSQEKISLPADPGMKLKYAKVG